jgi:hypothetical protein
LWNAWKAVRQQLKRSNHRDIADDLEYDIDPEVWISRFLTARLLALNSKPAIHTWLRAKKKAFHKSKISTFDKRLVKKLL